MNPNNTILISRGYEVELPTCMVSSFLALSHDDQVEMAEQFNRWDEAEANETQDEARVTDLLIESMASELDQQDQMLANQRREIATLVDAANGLYAHASALDQAVDTFMAERGEIENLNEILVQSSRYVGQVRELLSKLGVTVETDARGIPNLCIDADRFAAAALVVEDVAA